MAVTGTSVAAAATMLAAAAAIFVTFVLCFYLFLCAKRYRGAAPTIGGAGGRARFVFTGGAGCHGAGDGMAGPAIAALPRKAVAPGDSPADCAVCIAELAPGEVARVLPRCGHGFHVDCVDVWLRSHSTCPLCRCAVVDEVEAVRTPEADPESPVFPTNVLFFGSQDAVSTRGAATAAAPPQPLQPLSREPPSVPPPQHPAPGPIAAVVEAARVAALRRLLGCGGATPSSPSPPQQPHQEGRDLESGLGGAGESSQVLDAAAPPSDLFSSSSPFPASQREASVQKIC